MEYLDQLTKRHTMNGYSSFQEMLDAEGGHRPHFDLAHGDEKRKAEVKVLAERYDAAQAERGDSRRAHVTN